MKRARTQRVEGTERTRSVFKLVQLCALLSLPWIALPAHAAGTLVLFPDPMWLVVMITAFALLVFPMNALLFKPIFRVLDERKERIDGARRRAAQLQGEADQILQRYREAVREVREETDLSRRQQIESARAESASAAGDARSDAEATIERGRIERESWLTEARTDLRSSVEPLARTAAERVLGRELD